MITVMSLFLTAALQPALPALEGSMKATGFDGVAIRQGQDLTATDRVRQRGPERLQHAGPDPHAGPDDWLFYFVSHAQAVSDASDAPLTPWLELRPLTDHQLAASGRAEQ